METDTAFSFEHREAGLFDARSFRTIEIDKKQGVKAVTGCPKGQYMDDKGQCKVVAQTQNFIFPKSEGWTLRNAQKWFRDNVESLQPLEERMNTLHADFRKILDNFLNFFGRKIGQIKYRLFLKSYSLDETDSYASQIPMNECLNGICEAFQWTKPFIEFLREDNGGKYYKVRALTANISMNHNDYSDRDKLEKSARTLTWRPLNINHDKSRFLPFPENRVDWAEFEDNAVETIIRIDNQQKDIQDKIDNGEIVNPSIEGRPIGGERTRDGVFTPAFWNYTALALLEKDLTLPGDPTTFGIEPLFINESLGRSLVESLSMDTNKPDEKTMSETEETTEQGRKFDVTTKPWDGSRSRFNVCQLWFASSVVKTDGAARGIGTNCVEDTAKGMILLPHHEPGNGEVEGGILNRAGVIAAGNATMGARGADLSSQEKSIARAHLNAHYRDIDLTPPWREREFVEAALKEAGIQGMVQCLQCKFFRDLSDTTTKRSGSIPASDSEVTLTHGSIGPGVGVCEVETRLTGFTSYVRKADVSCTDGRPRDQATDADRTKESVSDMEWLAEKTQYERKIADLEEKLLDKDKKVEEERTAKLEARKELVELTDKLTGKQKDIAADADKISRLKKDVDDLREMSDKLKDDKSGLELDLEHSKKDSDYHQKESLRKEDELDTLKTELSAKKIELAKTYSDLNEAIVKRSDALARAQVAEGDKARIQEEHAITLEKLTIARREISDGAGIRHDAAKRELKLQGEVNELRESNETLLTDNAKLRRDNAKLKKVASTRFVVKT